MVTVKNNYDTSIVSRTIEIGSAELRQVSELTKEVKDVLLSRTQDKRKYLSDKYLEKIYVVLSVLVNNFTPGQSMFDEIDIEELLN